MESRVLAILVIFLSYVPKLALSFHGSHPVFHGAHPTVTESLAKPPATEAAPAQPETAPAAPSILVASPPAEQDKLIVAQTEMKIQRFGHKCKEREQAASTEAAQKAVAVTTTAASLSLAAIADKKDTEPSRALSAPPVLFQVASEDSNNSRPAQPIADSTVAVQHTVSDAQIGDVHTNAASASTPAGWRQVGEVALQENATAPESPSGSALNTIVENMPPALTQDRSIKLEDQTLGVGFSNDSQTLPILSDALNLPGVADGPVGGEHIHVGARIATQEVAAPHASSDMRANPKAMDSANKSDQAADAPALDLDQRLVVDTELNASREDVAINSTSDEAATSNSTAQKAFVQSQPKGKGEQVLVVSAPLVVAASPTKPGFLIRHRLALVLLVVLATIALMSGLCLVTGFMASFMWQRQRCSLTRSQVEELAICHSAEVQRKLPASAGYDCIFSKPLSSCELLRLEARIEGPAANASELTAPLTGQASVLYSVAVSRQLHDGMHPVPVAFASASIDFVISLRDSPQTRISLRGEDVSLFDMGKGRCVQRKSFAAAPERWQDFVLTHRAASPGNDWQTSAHLRSDGTLLEFQECALLVGSLATFVGELHRGADGTLTMRPLQLESCPAEMPGAHTRMTGFDAQDRWRTSWERDGCEAVNVASHPASPRDSREPKVKFDKVLASDDIQLLEGASSVLGSAAKLLRRLPGRAFALVSLHRGSTAMAKASQMTAGH